jgi:hypothetical protein
MIALGGCSIVLLVTLVATTGACLLFQRRGEAGDRIGEQATAAEQPASEIEQVRNELLVLSGDLSDPERESHDLTRAARHLEALDVRLEDESDDPAYLKVRALHESVKLQIEIIRGGDEEDAMPPLPYSPSAPPMDDRYVGLKVGKSLLVKGKIFSPSPSRDVRYGPALFTFARKIKKRTSIGSLEADKGWKFIEVEVGVTGKADLVEYSLILLDDYRRAYPPYLDGEKFLSRKGGLTGSSGKHAVWRDVHSTTSRKEVTWIHRVFALPADSIKNPIMEIHRQGASKKVWVQY